MAKQMEKARRLILLVGGESGTGKSFFVANMPRALIFDTDLGGGLAYLDERITRNGSERIEVGSYLDVIEELGRRRKQMAGITTLVIDHLTTLQQEAVLRHNPGMVEDFGKSYDRATREWRKVRELVRWGDFNLVCTAHMKAKYEKQKVVGVVTDASKNINADFDVVLYLRKTGEYPSQAVAEKWRRDPEDARGPVPQMFDFTVKRVLEIHGDALDERRRETPMATPEQLKEFERLLGVVKLGDGVLDKWMQKAKAECFAEFTSEVIGKCITHMQGMISPPTEDK